MAQYDIDYHSEKAETFRHLETATREYLARNAATLPTALIVGLAEEIKDFGKSATYQDERAEYYRALLAQAEAAEASPDEIIEVEEIQQQEATTL